MKTRTQQIEELQKEWTQPRWEGITRPYSAEEVVKLRGSVNPECTLAQLGAAKMWRLLHGESKKGYINSLGALTGGQALQQAKAGIEAVYLSGWQVAADANLASSMYPTNRCIRRTPSRQWWIGSTTHSVAPIRSNGQPVLNRTIRAMWITSCRSLPMRKRVLAAY